ncbi:hypothetical protein V5O48_004771, partial [Marasmius crinis-equi]
KKPCNDFMSMSDDSDDEAENDDSFIDIGLEFDVDSIPVTPTISAGASFRLASPPRKRTSKLLPSLSTPFHSFIDLAEHDTRPRTDPSTRKRSWRGRSFIEIASL